MARGRPLKYKTVAELESAVEDYFKKCKGETLKNKSGTPRLNKFGEQPGELYQGCLWAAISRRTTVYPAGLEPLQSQSQDIL